MIIRKYVVNSMNEAMTRIRYELGKDAMIIGQRKIRKSGIKGFFSKKLIEVTAAVDSIPSKENRMHAAFNEKKELENIKNIFNKKSDEFKGETKNSVEKNIVEKNIMDEISEMKDLIANISQNVIKDSEQKYVDDPFKNKLIENDVDKQVADEILEKLPKDGGEEEFKNVIKDMIKVSDVSMRGVVVLVGPTGVGKTTTIAKLAGRLALIEKQKVGLITIDTYRIGAVEQLKTYADIMNIPFKVVFNIKEMSSAIDEFKDCDVILIDTTGRSSKNVMQISELRAYIEKVNTDNIHLVMSCTTKNKDIETIVNGYKELNYQNVIVTKLDETTTYGSILNILYYTGKPISFITTGQSVPEDIKRVSQQNLASLVLGEDNIC